MENSITCFKKLLESGMIFKVYRIIGFSYKNFYKFLERKVFKISDSGTLILTK